MLDPSAEQLMISPVSHIDFIASETTQDGVNPTVAACAIDRYVLQYSECPERIGKFRSKLFCDSDLLVALMRGTIEASGRWK